MRSLEESYLADIPLHSRPDAKVVLEVEGLSRAGAYHDVSLQVRAGEVLGIYGFLGAGQLELARTLFGMLPPERGRIVLDGRPVRLSSAPRARRQGMAFVPESRRMMLFGIEPVFKNVTISILDRINRLWLRPDAERAIARRHVEAAAHSAAGCVASASHAVRRQPAESGLGEVVDASAARAAAERADTRHGCRRQGRRGEDRARPARAGDRDRRRLDRTGDGAVVGGSDPGHEERLRGTRIRRRTGQQGPANGSRMTGGILDWLRGRMRNVAPFATLILLVGFFTVASGSFATLGNLENILTQISVTGIIAVGLTFVILCAEIDLSVASIANATGIVVAYFTLQDASVSIANIPLPGWAAIMIALAACFALGMVNAFGMTRIGIPSFIMTLAMLQIAAGICALLVRGQIAYTVPPLVTTLGSHSLGPIPWIVVVAAVFLLVGHVVLTYTRFGRYVYMTGGNREAAEYSGVNVKVILSAVMIISAVCSGVAGMLGVAYFGSAQQNEFDTYLLDSISAVVVGGTSLFGGQGGIGNTIIGLFVLGILNNGLDHINIDSFLKILIRGLVLLVALAVNVYAQRMRTVRIG